MAVMASMCASACEVSALREASFIAISPMSARPITTHRAGDGCRFSWTSDNWLTQDTPGCVIALLSPLRTRCVKVEQQCGWNLSRAAQECGAWPGVNDDPSMCTASSHARREVVGAQHHRLRRQIDRAVSRHCEEPSPSPSKGDGDEAIQFQGLSKTGLLRSGQSRPANFARARTDELKRFILFDIALVAPMLPRSGNHA